MRWISSALLVSMLILAPETMAQQVSNREGDANELKEAGLKEVRVQLKWRHQFQFAGYYAAIEQGYYRDAGLAVTLIEHTPELTPIDQLMGGRVDFAVGDTGALIYRSTGVPVVALAAVFQHSPSILISLAGETPRDLSDFKGQRAMLSGGYMNAELLSMLRSVGVTPEDIELVPSNTSIDVLIDGQTEAYNAYTTNEPYLLQQRGIPYQVFHPKDYGIDFYGDILLTTQRLIDQDPDYVRAFRDATLKGWAYAVTHPEEIIDLILEHYNTQQKSRNHLLFEAQEAIKLILPTVVPIGYMNDERWRRIEAVFREEGKIANPVDLRDFHYPLTNEISFRVLLDRYRLEIVITLIVLVGGLLLFHNLRLRALVRLRTHELEIAKQRAEEEARTDPLSGLPNRRHFLEVLTRDVAQAERQQVPLCLIAIDIDLFKPINDDYGHAAGDEALRKAGEVLRQTVRSGDIAARIGGEEFAVICLNTDIVEARTMAERLRLSMAETPITYRKQEFRITFSLGLALMQRADGLETLMHNADQALYAAKQAGRNTVREWPQQT